jgi:cytochrome c oxidase subunit 2
MSSRRAAPVVLLLVAATALGCHGHPSVFAPAGPPARAIATLGLFVLITLSVVAAAMVVLIVWAAVRRTGSLDEHDPPDVGGGQSWIMLGGFVVPVIVLSALLGGSVRTMDRFPLHDGEHYRPDVRVVGRQWWWEVRYVSDSPSREVTSANEIHLPTNWAVEVELESRDVIHSFWVPALHGKVDLVPGHPNHIRLYVDTPGRYEGECAEFCGAQHTNMKLVVVAEPLDAYERWLAHEATPAERPPDEEAKRGAELFEDRACGLCHTVRGTRARGLVGPDLTHLEERRGLAAYAFPNSRAYLQAWITHAQSLKPGAQMPDLGNLRGDELQALAHYLEGLQ